MPPLIRPLKGALALWQVVLLVGLQLADGIGATGCTAHDMAMGAGHHAMAMAGAMPAHMGHHAPDAPPDPAHQHGGPCTCLGTCHGPALSGAVATVAILAAQVGAAAPGFVAPRAVPTAAASHLLPFAVGPPLSA